MKKTALMILLAGLVVFAITGCSALSSLFGTENEPEETPVQDIVSSLRDIEQPDALDEPAVVDPESEPVQDGDYLCTTTRYRATAEYDELLVLDPTTDVIFPGAILKGESIETGEYIPVIADRAPMTISVSLENLSGDVSRIVADPKLSTVRQAISDILNQGTTGATPAHMTFVKERVYSEEHLRLSLGAHYNYSSGVADVRTSFDFENETTRTRILVKFLQKYYTIDVDPPANADALFDGAVAPDDFGAATPVYVSTVTFGRLVLFAIESSEEYEEVSAALDAAFSSGAHSGDLQVSVEQERLLRSSSIKGTIIGGSGSDAAGTINGLDAMETFLEQGGNYSQDSPGAPISYKLRFLKDLSVAKIILMSEYEVRDCTLNVPDVVRVRVTLNHIRCDYEDDEGSHEEFYGYLGSAAHYEEPEIIPFTGRIPQVDFHYAPRISGSARLWEADSNAHVSLASGDSWPSSGSVADAVYEFEEPNRSLAYVVVEGHLYDEDDNSGDDDLTYQDATVFLRDIEASPTPVTKTLHFSRGATRGSAQFELSLVQ